MYWNVQGMYWNVQGMYWNVQGMYWYRSEENTKFLSSYIPTFQDSFPNQQNLKFQNS